MNISYHTWRDYKECPKRYFLKHLEKKSPTVPINDYHKIYGNLTQKFFELFCNTWRFNMPYMPPDEIQLKLRKLYQDILATSTINWDSFYATESQEEIFQQSFSDVSAIMNSTGQNYFLNTRSEVSIEVTLKDGTNITGILDFIHKDPLSSGITVFDGKGAHNMGKHVNNDQVLFYALLYYFHFNVVPEQLGFFYYRFNTFNPVPISLQILNEFRAGFSLSLKQILADTTFKATPSPKACKYCDYQIGCQECLEDRAKRKRPSKLGMPDLEGVVELGFN